MGTRPALSAGLPSSTSNTCHTLSAAVSSWHKRILSPSREGCAFEGDRKSFGLIFCWDQTLEGVIGTTDPPLNIQKGGGWEQNDAPRVCLLLLFHTSKFNVRFSWLSTIFSSSEASMALSDDSESPSNPTTKSKNGSIFAWNAGDEGVTLSTCKPWWGVSEWDVDCPAPMFD